MFKLKAMLLQVVLGFLFLSFGAGESQLYNVMFGYCN